MSLEFNGVKYFLEEHGFSQYWDIFKAKGFDRESDLIDLNEGDLQIMQIPAHHVKPILNAAQRHKISGESKVQSWLEQWGLGHYFENFRTNDLCDLHQVANLDLNDLDVFSELEMDVPAHRKRLFKAVKQLQKRRRVSGLGDIIAMGTWRRPTSLFDARNEFLCIKADMCSTSVPCKSVTLDFMVDSGSDVNTLREEVLADLDLELIGTVQSQGIHASRQRNMYRAIVVVGNARVLTEVIADTYDSIGNQVIRNFHHYISADTHYWLPGDQIFQPSSATEQSETPPESRKD